MTTGTPPTTKELLGGAAKSVKFEAPGDAIAGTLVNWSVSPVTKMGTGEIDTFPSGDPKYQFILTLQTSLRDDVDDDGRRTVYCKSHLFVAVKQAVAGTGAEDFEKGAWIQVVFTHLGEAQKGFSAPKMFSVEYKRPSAQMIGQQPASQQGQFLPGNQAGLAPQPQPPQPDRAYVPQQPPQQPAPQYAATTGTPAPQAAGLTPEQIASIMNLDPSGATLLKIQEAQAAQR